MAKIMIVDDDRTTVDLLKTLLELDGFEVFAVPDGEMAFQRAQELQPDIFLVDYHLSDFEGTEFVKQLRADSTFASTPVIMTSGLNREDEANACGANSFLIKPFDPGDLVDLIGQLLGTG
jgi:DNA-binding response OmpR family regulator